MKTLILFGVFVVVASDNVGGNFNIVGPGPKYPPTRGAVWPKPQNETKANFYYTYAPSKFRVKTTNNTCQILERAIKRFETAVNGLMEIARRARKRKLRHQPSGSFKIGSVSGLAYKGLIKALHVDLTMPCEELPYYEMCEEYNLNISEISNLTSDSLWGILRGLETASQLFYLSDDYTEVRIDGNSILDYPEYPHRGLLLDTSRHYIPVAIVYRMLDAMAMNKMNVFHWHIVDDQSFPYQSSRFPELSAEGAFYPSLVYTSAQVKSILAYAHDRGIRVLPEFDIPGHTRSWGNSHPEILTKCYSDGSPSRVTGLGPLHPLKKVTYKLIRDLFDEVQKVFPDNYFHIGGDEVDMECWISNPDIRNFMAKNNITDIQHVHAMFILKAISLLYNETTPIVWQEVFDNNVALPKNAIVQVWKNLFVSEMVNVLNHNHKVVLSAPWYLDILEETFSRMYSRAPREWVRGSVEDDRLELVVGGEACMWGEMVDAANVLSRSWPRASALAELLWTSTGSSPLSEQVLHRIEEHYCRMRRRGIPAEPPAGPGFCLTASDIDI